ncbi:hypothetical protein [Geodermatophilus sp. URMC 63]
MVETGASSTDVVPVRWPEEVDAVIGGDLTAAAAYVTAAGGAVVTGVAPCGSADRSRGVVGFTTSLGFPQKLRRIVRDPHVSLAFHAREHGFADSPRFVLVQGLATVDLTPSRTRLESFMPQAERFTGQVQRGPLWDRLLHEYYWERVFIDISVSRIMAWPDTSATSEPEVYGAPPPPAPPPQAPPELGVAPRVDVARLTRRVSRLAHQLLAYRGADGLPVVVPVRVTGHSPAGLHLAATPGLLPPGDRRAGLLAHSYRSGLIGLSTRTGTGWLHPGGDGRAVYAPHTAKGFFAPPAKTLLLVSNGLMAKHGVRRARASGLVEELQRLAESRPDPPAAEAPGGWS